MSELLSGGSGQAASPGVSEKGNNLPLFELHGPSGHIWKLFEDGRKEGFPPGTVILNYARPLLASLRGRIMNLESAAPSKKADVAVPFEQARMGP